VLTLRLTKIIEAEPLRNASFVLLSV